MAREARREKIEEQFEDMASFHYAYQKVFDLNSITNHKEDDVIESSKLIEKAFKEINFPISHNQLATAMVLTVPQNPKTPQQMRVEININ